MDSAAAYVTASRSGWLERGGVFVLTTASVTALAAAKGGYFWSSWSWACLVFATIAALSLVFAQAARFGLLGSLYFGFLLAFAGWQVLSLVWSASGAPIFEAERTFVYVTGVAVVLVSVRHATASYLLGGVLCGLALVDLYALGTRLLPDRLGSAGDLATNRLAAPIGYWNALGLASVMALVVGLGLAIRARSVLARSAAALALPVSASTLYFTFSRGSWIVLVIALLVLVALDARRLHLVTASGIVALPAAVAVLLSWHTRSLNRVGGGAPAALHDGHRLALLVALLALVSAAVATAAALIEPHITVGAALRRAYGCVLAALAVAAIAIGFAVAGGPAKVIRHGWHSFTAPPGQIDVGQQQSKRLFSLSNNNRIELWRAAWEEAKAHPLAGGGAGSFEQWWLAHRKSTQQVRDAHSLYLQTLGETGVVGLALLGLALLVPLAAALRGRRRPLVPFAAAAYVAYLVHVAGDWDWQLAGVTLPALALGAATVVMGRELGHEPQRERVRWAAVAAAGAAIFVSFLMVLGNVPLTRASNAADRAQWRDSARDARTAQRWLPWASEPDRLIGEAALARRDRPTARRALEAALGRDRENWQLWFDLSAATRGRASNRALAQAKALNPLSPEIAQLIEVGR